MQHNPDSSSLIPLLCILREKQPNFPIKSVVNETSIDITRKLLSEQDYSEIAEQLSHHDDLDVETILDFMLCLICDGHFSNLDDNRRARRLMFKVITKKLVMPRSLFLTGTGLKMDRDRDYIGSGGFGHVFKGELQGLGAPVALKVLYKTHSDIDFYREALMWRSLQHEFVLPFLGIYEDDLASHFFLVSPYMNNGTLAQWRNKENPSTSEIEDRMREVAQGLQYIHSEGVIHGDLRGANVLLDDDFHVQITDFGLTRISEATATQSRALHFNFAAPELFGYSSETGSDCPTNKTKMSDVFAFGCLYYEIQYDIMPFAGKPEMQIVKLVCEGKRPSRLNESHLCDRAWDLIQLCWEGDASRRPAMQDVVKFMVDSNCCIPRRDAEGGVGLAVVIAFIVILHFFTLLPLHDLLTLASPPRNLVYPRKTIEDWHVREFRPKWFGLFGEPTPIIYRTPRGRKAHQISVVDLDKRDIELQMWVDHKDMGSRDIELDSTVDCGEDVAKCLNLDFASALIVVPPGRHTVRAEIRKRNESEAFVWGKERQRRVMWFVKECSNRDCTL